MTDNKSFDGSLKDALMGLQHYVDLQIRYNKLLIAKRMGEVSSVFVLFMILLIIFTFAVLFLSFTFVSWFQAVTGNRYYGNLIVFGFYLLLGLIIYLFREPLIFSPIRKMFTSIFAGDDEEEQVNFNSKEALNLQLKNYREIIDDEEEHLREVFEKLGKTFTLPNIIQSASRSLYKSFVTTSHIARFAYNLTRKLTGGISRKKSKTKQKKEPPQIEEDSGDH